MLAVDELILQPQDVVLVIWIPRVVEKIENGDLHHRLVEVGRLVLDHLDRYNLLRLHVLTFDHLPERALAQNIQDQVSASGSA